MNLSPAIQQPQLLSDHFQSQGDCSGLLVGGNISPNNFSPVGLEIILFFPPSVIGFNVEATAVNTYSLVAVSMSAIDPSPIH